ncbi:MAG TPA: response regulator [Gemmatimonadales bacterium]
MIELELAAPHAGAESAGTTSGGGKSPQRRVAVGTGVARGDRGSGTGGALAPVLPVTGSGDENVPILLVDDQPANLDALEASLATSGCRFVLARTADEALLALLNQDFAAIVLDVMMPGMSGFELASMIKRRQRTQQVPLLFLTARMLDQQDELRGYAVGAVDYLTKPLDPQILRAKLAVFVELFKKRRALMRMNVELQRQITERQRMAEDLRRANQELETRVAERTAALAESGRRKDDFLAMLGHELRTPLSAIRSAAEALRLRAAESAELQTLQAILERQVRHLTRLTDDLLDISRLTRDKLTLQTERVPLAEIVGMAVEAVRPHIEKRGHRLTVDIPGHAVYVHGDMARLSQVVSNLLDNAAKYSEPGSSIELRANVSGGQVMVRVIDYGMGIDRDLLPKVFELFTQGDHSNAGGHTGLGLGLALARRLAEMHGGTLSAFSAGPGRGSEFVLTLPVVAVVYGSDGEPTSDEPGPTDPLPSRRVLVVEDNTDAATLLNVMLQQWGQETRVVHDGPAALDVAKDFRPHVVLLDLGLPKLHGYEVARRLKQEPWGRKATVIAVTGWGLDRDRMSEEAGIDHRLLKPVDPQALHALLAGASRAAGRASG